MDKSLTIQDTGLTKEVLNTLKQYDDFVNFYVQIDQAANGVSWMKADMLSAMETRLGDSSLRALSSEIGQNYSTLVSYVRVSKAFPYETRDEGASFSLHFQASFADSYSSDSKDFDGDERFAWIQKALDDNMSTRTLAAEIRESKAVEEETTPVSPFTLLAETIRRDLATLTRFANDGNQQSQLILQKIKGVLDDNRSF